MDSATYAIVLEVLSFNTGATSHSGDDLGTVLGGRVGLSGTPWAEKGSASGAQTNGRSKKLGFLFRNALQRSPMELTVVLLSPAAFLAPESVHAEQSLPLAELCSGGTRELKLGSAGVRVLVTAEMGQGESALFAARGVTPSPCAYADGSNWHGTDPFPPLQLSLASLASGTVLWGETLVPGKSHVAVHLHHAGVAFSHGSLGWRSPLEAPPLRLRGPAGEELPAHVAGAKPGWGPAGFPDCLSFAAVPMLETADGRVVNDVYVIMRHLIPALYGPAALTDAALAWERRLAYEYAPSLWAAASTADVATIFSRTAPAYPWLLTAPLSAAVHIGTKHVLLAEWATLRLRVGGEPQSCSLARIFADFRAALGGQPFVGGSFAGPTDLSFYGCTVLHYVTRCEPVTSLMTEHGLAPWHERMAALLPPRRALPPEGFGPSAAGYKMGWMCEPAQAEPVGARRDCVSR
jgi:hypothetical protein